MVLATSREVTVDCTTQIKWKKLVAVIAKETRMSVFRLLLILAHHSVVPSTTRLQLHS